MGEGEEESKGQIEWAGRGKLSLSSLLPSSFQISAPLTPLEGLIVSQVTMLLSLFVMWLMLLEFLKHFSPIGNYPDAC